jgi:MATE family multidrug resistance protein
MTAPDTLRARFTRLTFINILSNVTVPLVGLVDTAMLGHLADIRFLAGVALGTILFDYVYWSFGFLRMGTTGTTAQALGRGDRREVYLVLYRSLSMAAVIAAAILVLQWPLRELGFGLLSGEAGVEAAGRDYFDARVWGAPATLCNFVLMGWFLGRAESRHVLVMTIAGNLGNIALNYVFIIRMGMAAYGAGLATSIAQYGMLLVGLGLFRLQGGAERWRWREVMNRSRMTSLFRLNLDILIRTMLLVSSFAIFTNFSSLLGTVLLAANSILLRIFYLAAYLIDGAAFACESLAGIFYGRNDPASLRRLIRVAVASGLGFATLALGVLLVAPRPLLGLLTSHEEVIAVCVRYAPWLIPTLLFGALAFIYDGVFLGLTRGRTLRNAMIFCTLAVFLPLAWIGVRVESNHVLWAAMALFMLARAATLWAASIGFTRAFERAPGPGVESGPV